MTQVFLSYSIKDHHFAELVFLKLSETNISVWRDIYGIRAGNCWRGEIETAIDNSQIVIIALSPNSNDSSYVTFEWAYAIGRGKSIIPLKIADCKLHPRLEPIQYIDFSISGALPWQLLIERIGEVEQENINDDNPIDQINNLDIWNPKNAIFGKSILAYLQEKGFQMMSFDKIRKRISDKLTDADLNELILNNRRIFSHATLKNGIPGLKRIVP